MFPITKTTLQEGIIQYIKDRKNIATEWTVFLWTRGMTFAQILERHERCLHSREITLKENRTIFFYFMCFCSYRLSHFIFWPYVFQVQKPWAVTFASSSTKQSERHKCIPRSGTAGCHKFVQSTREVCQLKAAIHWGEILHWGWSLEWWSQVL
jgi:hypothetical protein